MQFFFVILLALECINTVDTYQCYFCTDTGKKDCGDPFNSKAMTDADKMNAYDDRVCSKAMWTVIETGDKELQRLPIAAGSCPAGINECGKMTDAGLTGTVCCCNTELCNGATTIQQQSLLVYLIIGILAIITDSWF